MAMSIKEFLGTLGDTDRASALKSLASFAKKKDQNKLASYIPYPKLREFHDASAQFRERMLMGSNQSGKALRNGTPVLTPTGWRAIESLRVGDLVIAGDGAPALVLGVYPQGVKPLHRLDFGDGRLIDCCGEHLWKFKPPSGSAWEVADTNEIIRRFGASPGAGQRVRVPLHGDAGVSSAELHSIAAADEDECTCISVAHPDRTFVTEHGVVTHNTYGGAFETAIHLTGRYPADWKGHRFAKPIRALAASVSQELTRVGVQRLLIGNPEDMEEWGTGAIPKECLGKFTRKMGTANCLDTFAVKHISGGWSVIRFASYEQGQKKFQADTLDFVWLDEEPPLPIYTEALTRTNVRSGLVMLTATPLLGMSEVVSRFYANPPSPGTTFVQMGIKDALHYSEEQIAKIMLQYPEHERGPRLYGIPQFGEGMVFAVKEADIVCEPFEIPKWWKRCGAIDFGWSHPTACVKLVINPDDGMIYIVANYRQSKQTPLHVAAAVGAWGDMPWFWPHDGLQHDKGSGQQLKELYREAGLDMWHEQVSHPEGGNGVHAGIQQIQQLFDTKKLKIFSTCVELLEEIRSYHRKTVNGQSVIVKEKDDTICAMRYAIMMMRFARAPVERKPIWQRQSKRSGAAARW